MTDLAFRTSFPDLDWLRTAVAERRANGQGWPTIVHHVHAAPQVRNDIDGPLSIFFNLSGRSVCEVGGTRMTVSASTYAISNPQQLYTLHYDQPTEVFNIHIADDVATQWLGSATTSLDVSLDNGSAPNVAVSLRPCSTLVSDAMHQHTSRLRMLLCEGALSSLAVEETMVQIMSVVMSDHMQLEHLAASLPRLRAASREEVLRRLFLAREALHAMHHGPVSLDMLASVACMSKYHFLRAFTAAFGISPHQYVMRLRVASAAHYLSTTDAAFSDIALRVGCESVSSFAATFKKITGRTPGSFRTGRKAQFSRATAADRQRTFASTLLN
jgi:AraC family transcriptional regulator